MVTERTAEDLVPTLLMHPRWPEYAEMLDSNMNVLVSDEVDGRLALIASVYRHDWDFVHRIGAIRNSLELGRHEGFDGVQRPLSAYFTRLFGPQGTLTEYKDPTPPPPLPDLDPDTQMLTHLSMALLYARTWEQRRRILVAYQSAVDSGQLELMLRAMQEAAVPVLGLPDIVAAAKTHSPDVAVADAPLGSFLRLEVSGEPALFAREERLQLAFLAYLHTPSWVGRREILREWSDPLLTTPQDDLDRLWGLVAQLVPAKTITPARDVLNDARRSGIAAAFQAQLPPTHVIMASAVWALNGQGEARDRVDDLRRLVHFYDPGIFPTAHAVVATELADVLHEIGSESTAALLEEAAEHAASAVMELVGSEGSDASRRAYLTLGSAHLARTRGNLAAHGDAAIACFEKATKWAEEAGQTAEVGQGYRQLALAFIQRPNGVPHENHTTAIRHAEKAVTVYRSLPGRDRETAWALYTQATACQKNLENYTPDAGTALAERARALLEEALAITPQDETTLLGAVHLNLGSFYATRGPAGTADALRHLNLALETFSREDEPRRWGQAHHSLGAALMRGGIDDPQARTQARTHFDLALEVLSGEEWPNDRRRTLVALGGVEFREHRWSEALARYDEAMAISDYLIDFLKTEGDRFNELTEMRSVYERAALCLIRQGRPEEALPLLDAGKTRIARLVAGETAPVAPLDLAEIRALAADDAAVVVPLTTTQGSVLFVLTGAEDEAAEGRLVDLPAETEGDLRRILEPDDNAPGWLLAYRGWLQSHDPDTSNEDAEHAHNVWVHTISSTTDALWRTLMGPILAALQEAGVPSGTPIRIVPSKWLGLLPLGAAWRMVDDRPRTFVEDHPFVMTPSFFLLRQARASLGRGDRDPALVVVVDDSGTLEFAQSEYEAIRGSVPCQVTAIPSSQWSPADLHSAAGDASHLHIICHGSYEWGDPSGSGLELGSAGTLTARQISGLRLEGTQLVTLSACETGIADADRVPTEFVGLAGSFLNAGAATVLSTLWSADDESTSILMGHFYRGLFQEHLPASVALQRAQIAVRETPDFENPFFWALFVLFGR